MTFSDPTISKLHQQVTAKFGELTHINPLTPDKYYQDLLESIISQQLGLKAAASITARVRESFGQSLEPELILTRDKEEMRAMGLSYAKVSYMKSLAEHWLDGSIAPNRISQMSDEDVIEHLLPVKGIGRWTAEMFLIFGLGRPDVFSAGDYGLRKAITRAYGIDEKAKPEVFSELAAVWSPERSLASRVLWKSLELD